MVKKTKKIIFALASCLVIIASLCVSAFAMPSYNSELIMPTHSYNLKLGETLTGVSTGKFFCVPDAFASSPTGSPSAGVNAVTYSQTFTNDQYASRIRNASRTFDGIVYEQLGEIFCTTPGSTGSIVITPSQAYDHYVPLISLENSIFGTDYDDVIEINFAAPSGWQSYDCVFTYSITLTGYDVGGAYRENTHYGNIPSRFSNNSYTLYTNISRLIEEAKPEYDNGYTTFDGLTRVKELKIWACAPSVTTYQMAKLNYCYLWSTYEPFNDGGRRELEKMYYDGITAWVVAGEDSGSHFANSSWVTWITSTISGIMNVKLFGDQINFTLGGIIGSIIALGFVAAIIKIFGR